MHSFIFEVLKKLISKGYVISQLTFVLPNKRAGLFLKKELAKQATPPIFLPEIISIESFVEEVSQLKQLNNIEALFEFYALYASTTPRKETEPFDRFSKWATIVLQDFNEIDRHLVDPTKIFKYLSAIQEINHWSLDPNPTDMIKGYLRFWKQVGRHYDNFSEYLLNKDLGYQGLIYKNAVHNLEAYLQNTKRKTHIFLGFNALNAAESSIIQELLQQERAEIFWDADKQFLNSPYHDAGLFMRRYKKEWPYYRSHPFNGVAAHYMTPKAIHITGASKQISQVKYVGELLSELSTQNKLENTALILADENLLLPVLSALPPEVESVNITMGLPLAQVPLASFIDQWFTLQVTETGRYYYKDIIGLLSHPFVALLLQKNQVNNVQNIIHNIKRDNLIALSCEDLLALAPVAELPLRLLFEPCHASPKAAIQQLLRLFIELKKQHQDKGANNALSLEYIYRFSTLFQQIENYDAEYNIVDSIKTLQLIFKDVLTKETLNFKGQPLNGLQIMGMLESRVLDFETVIIVSVNEGILPAGKTQNSFIPFDVKTENNLPTYKEKDAVYTYHFYRLLHRANEVHLVYNTEPEALKGGEPSRFIAQLEL
ncbi:MAG TPA: PD-(D/E)XK nuclease family protein, partial [Flavobacteriaceae bacterium]|nr:PD-(D/E)XK nuclease family protein [Flavobacteriaceae bacterium]